ncbi:hypothetical protein [Hornefia butyriciproducens]|uniref:hypothetical protein n=1 Tax=Hornefia butyriciproducens TaxID=2652293 RepID=UPI002A9190D3|nr:hypothetical protein [Hornefia butyriciproducens]MDY6212377.1 hypothetical protein [Hornefia butyriciproducens]
MMKKTESVNNLSFAEIGGVGEMVYKSIRFSGYSVIEKNGIEWILPHFPSPFDPVEYKSRDTKLTGQDLLVSLCNLFHEMNNPGNLIDRYRSIMQWCTNNVHPYDIDELSVIAEECESGTSASIQLQTEGRFEPMVFLQDLERLGNTFDYVYALSEIKDHQNPVPARKLYYEGRLCDGYPFFEKYRRIKDDAEYVARVMEDMDDHSQRVIDIMPDFRMRLKFDKETGKIMYGADVRSVFDICWYTLSRIIADVAPPVDEDLNYLYSQGKILSCLCCGEFFIRRSGRQLYCNKPDCHAERNRKNRRASYARKKAAEAAEQAKKSTKKT